MTASLSEVPLGDWPGPVVMLDANILFQAAATRFLLGGAQAGLFRAVWTFEIADEARRNLDSSGRLATLKAFEENSRLVRDPIVASADLLSMARLPKTDAKDRHVLAAAINARASLLVTDNVSDFDTDEAGEGGVVVATGRTFAARLAAINPEAMVRHIDRVPPQRLERYVASLRTQFPEAIALLDPLLWST